MVNKSRKSSKGSKSKDDKVTARVVRKIKRAFKEGIKPAGGKKKTNN